MSGERKPEARVLSEEEVGEEGRGGSEFRGLQGEEGRLPS